MALWLATHSTLLTSLTLTILIYTPYPHAAILFHLVLHRLYQDFQRFAYSAILALNYLVYIVLSIFVDS